MTEVQKTAQEKLADYVEGRDARQPIVDNAPDLTIGREAEIASVVERINAAQEGAAENGVQADYRASTIDLDAVRAEMAEIRKLFEANDKADSDARKTLNETVQERLYKLVGRGIKQARVLMLPENEPALRELVEGTDDKPGIGASLAPTGGGRLVQIAALQIGYRSDSGQTKGKWIVPARRNERIGHIYAVILNKGWSDANCIAKIKELGGFAKVLAANPKRVSQASQDAAERREKKVAGDKAAPVAPFDHGMPHQIGQFRLAVVSIEDDGLKVHGIAPVNSDLRNRTCEDFIKMRYEQMLEAEAEAKLAD